MHAHNGKSDQQIWVRRYQGHQASRNGAGPEESLLQWHRPRAEWVIESQKYTRPAAVRLSASAPPCGLSEFPIDEYADNRPARNGHAVFASTGQGVCHPCTYESSTQT